MKKNNTLYKLMVVENDPQEFDLFQQAFHSSHIPCEITHYENATEAIHFLQNNNALFDLLFTRENGHDTNIIEMFGQVLRSSDTMPAMILLKPELNQCKLLVINSTIKEYAIENGQNYFHDIPKLFKEILHEKDLEFTLTQARKDVVYADVKLKQMQAQLIQQEKLASVGQLAAGIAHEINNPLGFISSNFATLQDYLKIIKKYLASLEAVVQQIKPTADSKLLQKITETKQQKENDDIDYILEDSDDIFKESVEGFTRMMSIIQNLKNFSRINHGVVEEYDVNKAIESTLIVARNEIKYVAQVEKQFSSLPSIECKGDEINQVFLNILVNAAQAIKSQNRSELGNILIKTQAVDDNVVIEICDDGPGIPHQIINKIFDPFFTTKGVGKGTGLGLSISQDIIVTNHHGELTVTSEIGKGTTFTIKIPLLFQSKKEEG